MTETPPPAAPDADDRPPGSPRRRRRVLPKVLIAVAVLLVAAIVGGVVYAVNLNNAVTKNITRGIDLPSDDPSTPGSTPRPTTQTNNDTGSLDYVLLGSDSRDPNNEGNGRSDSIMVVHLNKKRDHAYVISFPRDMYVEIPGHGQNKINAAFSFGGAALTVKTLEDLTGVHMDHVALVDFEGFESLTDDLGGVTVTNKTAFSSHGFDYPKGKISISGKKALWFVRERHSLPGGDLDRAANQRKVIKAIVEKGLSPAVLADPVKFTSFIANVAKHLTVDNSLSDSDIRRTALSLRLTGKNIELLQAPLSGFGTSPDGQSIDIVNTAQLAELSSALKDDTMAAYVKKYGDG